MFYYLKYNISYMSAKLALMLKISRKKKYTAGLKIFHSQELLPVSLETRVQYGGGEITRIPLNETRFGLKKSCLRYILALKVVPDISSKISALFCCTEWAWNWQIIFRCARIHGRACFNRWKEHPYSVQQYTPKSTEKSVKFLFQSSQGFTWFKY
jgi:hypothetical protein